MNFHKSFLLFGLSFLLAGCGIFDPAVKVDHSFDPPVVNRIFYSLNETSPKENSIEVYQNENFIMEIHFARLKELSITELKISDKMYYLKDNDYQILPDTSYNNLIRFNLCYTNPGEYTHQIQSMTYTNGEKTKTVDVDFNQGNYNGYYTIKKILDVPTVSNFTCTPSYNSLDFDIDCKDDDNGLEINKGYFYLYQEDEKDPVKGEPIVKDQQHFHFDKLQSDTKFKAKLLYKKYTNSRRDYEEITFYESEIISTKNGYIVTEVTRGFDFLEFKIENKTNSHFSSCFSYEESEGIYDYNVDEDKENNTYKVLYLDPDKVYDLNFVFLYDHYDFMCSESIRAKAKTLPKNSPSIKLFNEIVTDTGLDIDIRIGDPDNRLQDYSVTWFEDEQSIFSKLYKDSIYQQFHFDMNKNKTYKLKIIVFYKDGNADSKTAVLSINYPSELPLGLL